MKKKRILGIVTAMLMVIALALTGCGQQGEQNAGATDSEGRNEAISNENNPAGEVTTEPEVTNFKYIDRSGEHALDENSDIEFFDENGELKQNLLIKGNNLLALHTLKEKLAGKVKLIYIDPPYYFSEDKNSDTFSYNSNFKLSARLTFMRNRIEISKELLSNNGVILISIDEDGQSYLKISLGLCLYLPRRAAGGNPEYKVEGGITKRLLPGV